MNIVYCQYLPFVSQKKIHFSVCSHALFKGKILHFWIFLIMSDKNSRRLYFYHWNLHAENNSSQLIQSLQFSSYVWKKSYCLPHSAFPLRTVLTQFLIRKLLCTFTGRKARVSLATGAMCNRSEWLLLHPSFLGVRLHIFYKDNGITGQILPCSTLRVKSFNGKDAIRTGNLRENINCIMSLLPLIQD